MNALASWLPAIREYLTSLAVITSIVTLVFAIFVPLENAWPAVKRTTTAGRTCNYGIFLVCDVVLGPALVLVMLQVVRPLIDQAGHGWIKVDASSLLNGLPSYLWWPLTIAAGFIPLLVTDFFFYWWHRLQHASPWIWEEHRLHHTDSNVNITTSKRQHFLEEPLKTVFMTLPIGVLFSFNLHQLAVLQTLFAVWSLAVHANVRWSYGPLSGIFVSPQYHRIHHSIDPKHRHRNFANFFTLWDRLFGTFYQPTLGEYVETGVEGAAGLPTLREAVWGPFVNWRAAMLRRW